MQNIKVNLSSLFLPRDCKIRRAPTRDSALRHHDFWERFDAHTLFFDLYRTADPQILMAIAPPFHNLFVDLDIRLRAEPSGMLCDIRREVRVNVERLYVTVPLGTDALLVETSVGNFRLVPSPDLTDAFRSRRALLTLSKDNELVWVRDWAQYYVREHGVDTIVVYDNYSKRYHRSKLQQALETVPGLAAVAVVDWPFAYGPADYRRDLTVGMIDCDYCQRGMFEHAASRLFGAAAAVVNVDVDELIYRCGDLSLFDALDRSETGYLSVRGLWVEAAHDNKSRENRHAAYYQKRTDIAPESVEAKWIIDPRRLPRYAQWSIHTVIGASPAIESLDFMFGHFRAINTNWDLHQNNTGTLLRTEVNHSSKLQEIELLRSSLERAFPDRKVGMLSTVPAEGDPTLKVKRINAYADELISTQEAAPKSGKLLLQMSWRHFRLAPTSPDEAVDLLTSAISVDSGSPEIMSALICILHRHGRAVEALPTLEKTPLPKEEMPRGQFYALTAFVRLAAGDAVGARKAIEQALLLRRHKPGYHMLNARIHEAEGNINTAEAALRTALEIAAGQETVAIEIEETARRVHFTGTMNKDSPVFLEYTLPDQPWRDTIQFLLRYHRKSEAMDLAHEMIRRSSLSAASYALLARILTKVGDTAGAAKAACLMLRVAEYDYTLGPGSGLTSGERIVWHREKTRMLVEALLLNDDLTRAVALSPLLVHGTQMDRATVVSVARQLLRNERGEEALDLLDAVLMRESGNTRAINTRLEALKALGHVERLSSEVRRLEESGAESGEAWSKLGLLLRDHKKMLDAIEAFRRATAHNPYEPRYRLQMFWTILGQGDVTAASKIASDLVTQFPDLPMAHFAIAKLLLRCGQTADALCAVQRALNLQNDFPEAIVLRDQLQSNMR